MKIKKLYNNSILPTRGSQEAAGWDLYAYCPNQDYTFMIKPGEVQKIKTGVAVALDPGTAGLILPRSGLALKQGLRPANTPGLIDADYRGEIIVALYNDSDNIQYFKAGSRIAQMVVIPYISEGFYLVEDLDETERGIGSFGSTGLK